MSSFNVSEYNSYILINNENTSSGKWPTLVEVVNLCNANSIVHKLGICKDRGGLEYLNSLVFELKLNYNLRSNLWKKNEILSFYWA